MSSNGLERQHIKPDGNCFFNCIIHQTGMQISVTDLQSKLCLHLKENEQHYIGYFSKSHATNEQQLSKTYGSTVTCLEKDGVWNTDMSDVLPLATANVLRMNITIYSSRRNSPVIHITPDIEPNILNDTSDIKMAYLAIQGFEHYDSCVPRKGRGKKNVSSSHTSHAKGTQVNNDNETYVTNTSQKRRHHMPTENITPRKKADYVSPKKVKKTRKRIRNIQERKKNIRKHKRNTRQAYISPKTKQKIGPRLVCPPTCNNCKNKCGEKISEETRQKIFQSYYEDTMTFERTHDFICQHVDGKEEYSEFLSFTNVEETKILKHCSTRWLYLQKCVSCLLQQWPALESYFKSHNDTEKSGTRVSRCAERLSNPLYQLTYHFLEFIMGPLNEFNTTFQADESLIGQLHSEISKLLRKFMGKFVKTKVIISSNDITSVDFQDTTNHHDDEYIAIGMGTRRFIQDNPETSPECLKKFFFGVRMFYIEVTQKMIKKFPFHDPTLKQLAFVNPSLRVDVPPTSILAVARRFTSIADEDNLMEEIADFQLSPDNELPEYLKDGGRLDHFWLKMESVKTAIGKLRFKNLSEVALAALSLPHSNADPERCFSLVRKCRSEYRHNMSNQTLNSLLCVKMNIDSECYSTDVNDELRKNAKRACVSYQC